MPTVVDDSRPAAGGFKHRSPAAGEDAESDDRPGFVPVGAYEFRIAVVDVDDEVIEANEDDNRRDESLWIHLGPSALR